MKKMVIKGNISLLSHTTCKEAIMDSGAKLSKSLEKVIIEILLLYMVIPGKINFTQLGRFAKHCEQCYRQNFGRRRSKSINWLRLNISHLIVDDAFFSNRTFCDGIRKYGFHLVSRFRDDAHLCYLYEGGRTGKRGRSKIIDGKIDYNHLDKKRMKLLNIDGLPGKAYTLPAYSKALSSFPQTSRFLARKS